MSHERIYHHFRRGEEILLADPKSAKASYGHDCPEYLEQDDPNFLREGVAKYGDHSFRVFQLTEPSPGIPLIGRDPVGRDFIVVEAEQYSGTYSEGQIHKSKIVWNDTTTGQKKGTQS